MRFRDRAGQEALATNLRAGAERFSTRTFCEDFLALTREFLESEQGREIDGGIGLDTMMNGQRVDAWRRPDFAMRSAG